MRYLLSADRRLQKISLRKLSDRLKRTRMRVSAARRKAATSRKKPSTKTPEPGIPAPPKAYSWRAIVVGMVCVLAAAALMTARQPAGEGERAEGAGSQLASIAPPAMSVAAAKTPASVAPPKPASNPAPKPASDPAPKPTAPARPPDAEPAPMKTVSAAGIPPEATITGCLDRDDDRFWLKDTSGDVPKARSWKTGFLRKQSPKIELVGGPGASTLSGNVGKRVEVTGTLVDRELRARSIRRVAATCR